MVNNLIARRRTLLKEYGGGTPSGDPWEALFTSINNGTYTTDYAIGDLIPLDLGTEGLINMQIVAFDADTEWGTNTLVPITLISKELLATTHRMNPARQGTEGNYDVGTGAIRGWWMSEMRSYMNDTILPLIPAAVANRIITVKKYSYDYNPNGSTITNRITDDKVWIPSYREILGGTLREPEGPTYSDVFNSEEMRAKSKPNSLTSSTWWLRSAANTSQFHCIKVNGFADFFNAPVALYIAFGFCVG